MCEFFNRIKKCKIVIRNIQGKIVKSGSLTDNHLIEVIDFSNGIYFIELLTKTNMFRSKFAVQH
ncbi:MAG: T9SS type A sorting domain-containing protein [Bacteroidetes bacterium]|nr:T9SS type A sorting domain-containing protein [Bacteroidota bacterium]